MLIILEGPDGAGKTTLARNLIDLIKSQRILDTVQYIHAGPPNRHPIDEYLHSLTHYRPSNHEHIIIDRWHWGESVYPELLQRETKLDFPARWAIEAYLKRLGAVVVLVDQFDADYITTYAERGEYDELTRLADTKAAFAAVAATSQLPFVMYNWKDPRRSSRQEIVEVAAGLAANYRSLNGFITYCGPRWPQYLLLGDVRHHSNLVVDAPAFAPFPATSGHFLLKSLESAFDLRQRESIGWANVNDVDNPAKLWMALGKPNVVALGRNAHRRLNDLGIPHGIAPHPQFARRFHHSSQVGYGHTVAGAVTFGRDESKWPESLKVKPESTSITT